MKENGDLYLSHRCVKKSGGWLSVEEFGELAGMKTFKGGKDKKCKKKEKSFSL